MMDDTMAGDIRFELPSDLVTEADRSPLRQGGDYRVETWRPSWLTRLMEALVGKG